MITYRIRDWSRLYETHETRKLKRLSWLPVQNKHDGEGYCQILSHEQGIVIYGAFHLILQVASKGHPRGTLAREDGSPLDAKAIALKARWRRPEDIQLALDFCSSPQVGWIEALTQTCEEKRENLPAQRENLPTCRENAPDEWKGIEGNGLEGKGREKTVCPPPPSEVQHLRQTLCRLFARPSDAMWDGYEGGMLVEVGRSATKQDIDLFAAWYAGQRGDDRKTLPQSIRATLDRWSSHMDRARAWKRPAASAPAKIANERAIELQKKAAVVRSWAGDEQQLAALRSDWASDWDAIQKIIQTHTP